MIDWQKWSFHIGFNYREGTVISDVRYDGRKTFYRLSVSDMVSKLRAVVQVHVSRLTSGFLRLYLTEILEQVFLVFE